MTYCDSYYSRSSSSTFVSDVLDGEIETPVCIIGGGLAGVSTSLGLAERGVNNVVLEAQQIGWGASGRNGGFVGAGFSQNALVLAKHLGEAKAQTLYALTQDAYQIVKQRLNGTGDSISGGEIGRITASWFNEAAVTRNTVDEMNRIYGENLEFWPREKISESYLTKRYYDGYYSPQAMQFQSLDYVLHTAGLAQNSSAKIFENNPANHIQKVGDKWVVITPSGTVKADKIVYACSAYIDSLHGKLARATLPVATYVLLTEPLGDRLASAVRAPFGVADNRFSSNYYRVVGDKQLLWGGRVSMFHPSDEKLKDIMLADLLSVYPQLKGIKAEVAWGGHMGYARHKMPQLGCLGSDAWYCQGFGGHGMVTTTMGGELIASAIAADDNRYQLFKPYGLDYVGKPFGSIITQFAYWMFQLQDALKVAKLSGKAR